MAYTAEYRASARYSYLNDLQSNSLDMHLAYCGWQACPPSHSFGPDIKTVCVIHVVKSGRGTLHLGDRTFPVHENQAFFIPAKEITYYEADADDPWDYVWVGIDGLKASEFIESAGFSLREPVRDITCGALIYEYVNQMLEARQLSYGNELKRNGLLMLCISALIEDYSSTESAASASHYYPGEVYVKCAQDYIACHFHERIKINELADLIGVNRSYLTKNFKAIVGCSPQELLISLRIEKAKTLLKTTQLPINEIACAVGYSDQLTFSRLFKRSCGQSPRMYRSAQNQSQSEEKTDLP